MHIRVNRLTVAQGLVKYAPAVANEVEEIADVSLAALNERKAFVAKARAAS